MLPGKEMLIGTLPGIRTDPKNEIIQITSCQSIKQYTNIWSTIQRFDR